MQVPTELLEVGLGAGDVQRHIAEWLVLSLFTEGRVSSGKAARLLAMSRHDFLDLLRRRGVAYIDMTEVEMDEEFASVRSMQIDPKS